MGITSNLHSTSNVETTSNISTTQVNSKKILRALTDFANGTITSNAVVAVFKETHDDYDINYKDANCNRAEDSIFIAAFKTMNPDIIGALKYSQFIASSSRASLKTEIFNIFREMARLNDSDISKKLQGMKILPEILNHVNYFSFTDGRKLFTDTLVGGERNDLQAYCKFLMDVNLRTNKNLISENLQALQRGGFNFDLTIPLTIEGKHYNVGMITYAFASQKSELVDLLNRYIPHIYSILTSDLELLNTFLGNAIVGENFELSKKLIEYDANPHKPVIPAIKVHLPGVEHYLPSEARSAYTPYVYAILNFSKLKNFKELEASFASSRFPVTPIEQRHLGYHVLNLLNEAEGDVRHIQYIIEKHSPDLNICNEKREKPYVIAAKNPRLYSLLLSIKKFTNFDEETRKMINPLLKKAIADNNKYLADRLHKDGANITSEEATNLLANLLAEYKEGYNDKVILNTAEFLLKKFHPTLSDIKIEGQGPLLFAIFRGYEGLEILLKQYNAILYERDKEILGEYVLSLLYQNSEYNNNKMKAQHIITKYSPNLNIVNLFDQKKPYIVAAQNKDLHSLLPSIKKHTIFDEATLSMMNRLLKNAIKEDDIALAEILYKDGAVIKDKEAANILTKVIEHYNEDKNFETAKFLLEKFNPPLRAIKIKGENLLLATILKRHYKLESLLRKHDAELYDEDREPLGRYVLEMVEKPGKISNLPKDITALDEVKRLIKLGPNLNVTNSEGKNIYVLFAENFDAPSFLPVIAQNTTFNEATLAHIGKVFSTAIIGNKMALAEELIKHKIELSSKEVEILLSKAIMNFSPEATNLLINKLGANIKTIDLEGKNALMYALEKNQYRLADVIKQHITLSVEDKAILGKKLVNYLQEGRLKSALYLAQNPTLIDHLQTDEGNSKAIITAAQKGYADVISLLARLNFNLTDQEKTALGGYLIHHISQPKPDVKVARALLNLDLKFESTSPLLIAINAKMLNLSKELLAFMQNKGSMKAMCNNDREVIKGKLFKACEAGDKEQVEFLIKIKSDWATLENNIKLVPLLVAAEKNFSDIVKVLAPHTPLTNSHKKVLGEIIAKQTSNYEAHSKNILELLNLGASFSNANLAVTIDAVIKNKDFSSLEKLLQDFKVQFSSEQLKFIQDNNFLSRALQHKNDQLFYKLITHKVPLTTIDERGLSLIGQALEEDLFHIYKDKLEGYKNEIKTTPKDATAATNFFLKKISSINSEASQQELTTYYNYIKPLLLIERDPRIMQSLLDHGHKELFYSLARVHFKLPSSDNKSYLAQELLQAVQQADIEKVTILFNLGADPDSVALLDNSKIKVFNVVKSMHNIPLIKVFIENGAYIGVFEENPLTATEKEIITACRKSYLEEGDNLYKKCKEYINKNKTFEVGKFSEALFTPADYKYYSKLNERERGHVDKYLEKIYNLIQQEKTWGATIYNGLIYIKNLVTAPIQSFEETNLHKEQLDIFKHNILPLVREESSLVGEEASYQAEANHV